MQWEEDNLTKAARRTYARLLPRLEARVEGYPQKHPQEWKIFLARLERHFNRLFGLLLRLYGDHYDFFFYLEELLVSMGKAYQARPFVLKQLDNEREADPDWFQSNQMLGGVCYVDLFAKDLEGIRRKIPYFKELGLTYLHLMPLFRTPLSENDGGYAVSSYREIDKRLGSIEQLIELAEELRQNGISLVLDFVFNHTSHEHEWAILAQQGSEEHQEMYWLFADRSLPDQYEKHLREIFPEEHRGAFTYYHPLQRWVWTTFHSYQWDLNYSNPLVFTRICEEMLFLANIGVDVLRLDALAFVWKELGTSCENLPQAHWLIQAFNTVVRITAPAMLFKSEAIVHPDEVARYIHADECQLSYNPLLMALLWETLATREVKLLAYSLRQRFGIPKGCAWVNYVRCHDDIGWTFSDEDARRVGIDPYGHRLFLNRFYTGRFEGSFARGLPFQENPRTGDCRISGTCASLAGLEKALMEGSAEEIDLAVRRIVLLYAIILTIGGIPLIYLGDEIGTLNDYSYSKEPGKARDSRWVHRSAASEEKYARRFDESTIEGKIYHQLQRLIKIRKSHPAFGGEATTQFMETENEHILGYVREGFGEKIIVLANFSEHFLSLDANLLRIYGATLHFEDWISEKQIPLHQQIEFEPYQVYVISAI